MSETAHKAGAPHAIRCFIVTVSDTRTDATDSSGRTIVKALTDSGHRIVGRSIVKDDAHVVRELLNNQLSRADDDAPQVIILTGGTGITSRDSTFEAVDALLEKRLDGFGELFRMLSYAEIGSAAMMSRATAGLVRHRIVISLPGSEGAVRLAMDKLVVPELGHLVQQANK